MYMHKNYLMDNSLNKVAMNIGTETKASLWSYAEAQLLKGVTSTSAHSDELAQLDDFEWME